MEFKFNKCIIYFDFMFIIVFILSIIFKNIFSIFFCYLINYIFVILHEMMHYLVAKLFGVKIKKINILLSGLFINLEDLNKLTKIKRIIVYLAGPFFNLIISLILKKYKIIYYINFMLFMLNLLPLKNFDGYNILKEIIKEKYIIFINKIIFIILIFINFILIFKYNNYFLFIILVYYFLQNKFKI